METFSLLDNDDFKRLELTTKMVKIIQKYQKLLANVEEEIEDTSVEVADHNVATSSKHTTESISLEQVLN